MGRRARLLALGGVLMAGLNGFLCGTAGAPADALRTLTALVSCCLGAAEGGPADCTCWEPEYDLAQQPPQLGAPVVTRSKMCDDCAYRPTSPERTGDPNYVGDFDEFAAGVFFCHQGMRKPLRWRHRLGITVEATGDFYAPPLRPVDDHIVAFKADGGPADRCAGWDAHSRLESNVLAELAAHAGEA